MISAAKRWVEVGFPQFAGDETIERGVRVGTGRTGGLGLSDLVEAITGSVRVTEHQNSCFHV